MRRAESWEAYPEILVRDAVLIAVGNDVLQCRPRLGVDVVFRLEVLPSKKRPSLVDALRQKLSLRTRPDALC